MNILRELYSNKLLITAALSWLIAQIIKTIIDLIINKKIHFERLVGSGGMPSCHSATVTSLATMAALEHGLASTEFAICTILAIIVMYDARGVRRETGKQAEVINQIINWINNPGKTESPIKFTHENLKELVGHTPLQVFCGALLGIALAFIFSAIL